MRLRCDALNMASPLGLCSLNAMEYSSKIAHKANLPYMCLYNYDYMIYMITQVS